MKCRMQTDAVVAPGEEFRGVWTTVVGGVPPCTPTIRFGRSSHGSNKKVLSGSNPYRRRVAPAACRSISRGTIPDTVRVPSCQVRVIADILLDSISNCIFVLEEFLRRIDAPLHLAPPWGDRCCIAR
jgi:hypothetical protein